MFQRPPRNLPIPVLIIWGILAIDIALSVWNQRWSLAFIALLTFGLMLLPLVLIRRIGIRLPPSFTVAIALFVFATVYLGEAFDFYEKYWWWDIALHGGSALGFGMTGFLFAFIMFEGDRYHAPPWALSLIGFTFAMTIGALWEIFEWTMDLNFGTYMQKSGLPDTMGDLVVDAVGGLIGAGMGFLFLMGRELAWPSQIGAFLRANRGLMRRRRPKP